MKKTKLLLLLLAFIFTVEISACSYPPPKKKHYCTCKCSCGAYKYIPRNYRDFKWYHVGSLITWTSLGNDDDGVYGEKPSAGHWTDEKIGPKRAAKWWIRNPLHNFCFYVIGTAYTKNSEFVLLKLSKEETSALTYHKQAKTVFAGKGTSFFLGFHGWKPFISLRIDYGRRFECYFGWRERGNFGIKCVLAARSITPVNTKIKQNGMIGDKKIEEKHGREKKI